MKPGFTAPQMDHICSKLEEWYRMWDSNHPPQKWLGFAKEELKEMILGDEYTDNSEDLKTEIKKLSKLHARVESVASLISLIYSDIEEVLDCKEQELRSKLGELQAKLATEMNEILECASLF